MLEHRKERPIQCIVNHMSCSHDFIPDVTYDEGNLMLFECRLYCVRLQITGDLRYTQRQVMQAEVSHQFLCLPIEPVLWSWTRIRCESEYMQAVGLWCPGRWRYSRITRHFDHVHDSWIHFRLFCELVSRINLWHSRSLSSGGFSVSRRAKQTIGQSSSAEWRWTLRPPSRRRNSTRDIWVLVAIDGFWI